MLIRQTLRRTAAVALLAVLPVLIAPAAQATESDPVTAVVADDPGWGVAPAAEPTSAPADAGWG